MVDGIWRAFYRWLLDFGFGTRYGTLLDEVVILCGIDISYTTCVLRRMVACMGVGYTLDEEHWALGGRMLSLRSVGITWHVRMSAWLKDAWVEGALLMVVCVLGTHMLRRSVGALDACRG